MASDRKVLLFSGGKDSLACFLLLKPYWSELAVVWVNTGDAFPETIEIVNKVKKLVPMFLEMKTDVKTYRETVGYPSDVVPISHTALMNKCDGTGNDGVKVVSTLDCCATNRWTPVQEMLQNLRPTEVFRGERKEESLKSPVRDGHVGDFGEVHRLPIWGWTEQQVLEYIRSEGWEVPYHFRFKESSLDCMGCTGYWKCTKDRTSWFKEHYSSHYARNKAIIDSIVLQIENELEDVKNG